MLVSQPPEDEPKHALAGRIEPVGVVDGDEQRTLARLVSQERQDRRAHRPLVDSLGRRRRLEQRGGERLALRIRERQQRPVAQRRQQIAERGERQSRLGLDRACREHGGTRRARSRHPLLPDRGLADPGLADQHRRGEVAAERRDEVLELRELGITADDPGA